MNFQTIQRIYQKNPYYVWTAATALLTAAVLIALRIFKKTKVTSAPSLQNRVVPLTPFEKIGEAANKAREEARRSIAHPTAQTEILNYIQFIEKHAKIGSPHDPSLAQNFERKIECVIEQIREIPQLAAEAIESCCKLTTPEGIEWAFKVREALYLNSKIEELFREGAEKRYLDQQFIEFMGGTLFHYIAKKEQYKDLIALFKRCNPTVQDFWGNTGLIWAIANAANGNAKTILETMGPGPYLDVQCIGHGNTALHLAVGKGYKAYDSDGTPLACSNFFLVQLLVEKKANSNLQNREGNTPLHLAYLRRHHLMIQKLLDAGANSEITNQKGQKPADMMKLSYQDAKKILEETVVVYHLDQKEFN